MTTVTSRQVRSSTAARRAVLFGTPVVTGVLLLSSDDYGSSVGRTAKLHPLWQAQLSRPGVGSGRCVVGVDAVDGGGAVS